MGEVSIPKSTPEAASKGKLEDLGLPGTVLAAVASGLGVLGFVAFFGAAILWVRMDEAGLPANEAVALVPNSVLVSTGASFLVPSLLVALGFVVLLFLAEQVAAILSAYSLWKLKRELEKRRRQSAAKGAIARIREEAMRRALADARRLKEAEEAAIASGLQVTSASSGPTATSQESFQAMESAAIDARSEHRQAEQSFVEKKKEVEEERIKGVARIERGRKIAVLVLTAVLFVGGAVATIAFASIDVPFRRLLALAPLLLVLATVCVIVRWRTSSFAWLTAVVFAAVGLLSGVLTYYRTVDEPKVEAAALLRKGGAPVYGFFVAQTSDRVYLGVSRRNGLVSMDAFPRDEVTELAIENLQPPEIAAARGPLLALELCKRVLVRPVVETPPPPAEKAGDPPQPPSTPTCTTEDMERLRTETKRR